MTLDGLKYEVKPLEEGDADLIERKAEGCRYAIVPPEDDAEEELIFKICDDGGNIIAGCIVEVDGWKVADLDILWVDERYRRQGMGSALIREAERVSREKGCYAMVLGTFDFQARPLYEKHGFMLSGTIEDWPRGHRNFSMMKWLDSSAGEYAAPKDRAYKIEFGTEEDEEFIISFYRYAFLGVIMEWIDRNMKDDPEQIVHRLDLITRGVIRQILSRFIGEDQ